MSYNGRESGTINGKEIPLGQYVETADYMIFKENGTIKAKDGSDGSIIETGDYINEVMNAVPEGNNIDSLALFYIKPKTRSLPRDAYTVTAPIKDIRFVVGAGNPATFLKLADGANCNMFEYTGEEKWITRIANLRLDGNHGNNTSGTGIYNEKVGEFKVVDCEIRDFADYGIHFNPDVDIGGYQIIRDSWVLTNTKGGIQLSTQTGGLIRRINLYSNILTGANEPFAVHIPSGADINKVLIQGNRIKTTQVETILKFQGGQDIHIGGNSIDGIESGNYGIRFVPPSAHSFYATVQGNTFEGMGNGIEINADADYIDVMNNKFRTNLSTPMDIASGGNPNGVIQDNVPQYTFAINNRDLRV